MIRVRAAAKVNLALDVLRKRADGYHDVDMIMQSVGLYDDLLIGEADELSLRVEGDAPSGEDNLVLRAARLLQKETGYARGASIALRKRIPVAAGLAGGSADAAGVLAGLSRLWKINLSIADLQAIGAKLGADIPFCIAGGTMRATGIGTTLRLLPPPPSMWLLIDRPCDGMLTKDVYSGLRLDALSHRPDVDDLEAALSRGSYDDLLRCCGNVLESVTLAARPEAKEAIEALLGCGADAAHMTGSGPAVFGIFKSEAAANAALTAYGRGTLCAPAAQGLLIAE